MPDLTDFAIARRWPAANPDQIQYYGLATPNGVKVSIMLEETALPYEAHLVDISMGESHSPEFLAANPNGKIPVILDPQGPGGKPLLLSESGAILHYLAEKTGKLLPGDPALRWETLQWVHWQMSALGPMLGQLGFFHKFAGREWEDKRPRDRYAAEARRLLTLLDQRLGDREWIMGADFTIADIACIGWVRGLITFYAAGDLVGYSELDALDAWAHRALKRPGVAQGLRVLARG